MASQKKAIHDNNGVDYVIVFRFTDTGSIPIDP